MSEVERDVGAESPGEGDGLLAGEAPKATAPPAGGYGESWLHVAAQEMMLVHQSGRLCHFEKVYASTTVGSRCHNAGRSQSTTGAPRRGAWSRANALRRIGPTALLAKDHWENS